MMALPLAWPSLTYWIASAASLSGDGRSMAGLLSLVYAVAELAEIFVLLRGEHAFSN
jgi:hypothetical protein